MKKSVHFITYLILSVLLMGLIGTYSYFVLKTNELPGKADILKADTISKTNLLKNLDSKSEEMRNAEQQNQLAMLDTLFIKSGDEFTLINKVEDICSKSNVECDIKPLGVESEGDVPALFHAVNLIITIKGSFVDTYQFITAMEDLPYRATISKVILDSVIDNSESTASSTPKIKNKWRAILNLTVTTIK